MNERIKAYLKLHYCRDYFNAYGETVEDDHYFMYREEVDGLIELIVREYAKLADELTSQPCNSYGEKIRQHFGVEE